MPLYTEDVKEINGIHYLAIREERDDGSKCDKRLKTKQSKRDVPIHPELKRIGFLEFVAVRRKDHALNRLFPQLSAGRTGYFSNSFSKWIARFVENAVRHSKIFRRMAKLIEETFRLISRSKYNTG